jgi:hypothetical protein
MPVLVDDAGNLVEPHPSRELYADLRRAWLDAATNDFLMTAYHAGHRVVNWCYASEPDLVDALANKKTPPYLDASGREGQVLVQGHEPAWSENDDPWCRTVTQMHQYLSHLGKPAKFYNCEGDQLSYEEACEMLGAVRRCDDPLGHDHSMDG